MIQTYIIPIVLGICFQSVFITVDYKGKMGLAALFKGLASICFAVLGLITINYATDSTFAHTITAGLIIGALGDIILAIEHLCKDKKVGHRVFLFGTAVFFLGHIMYLIALIPNAHSLPLCIVIALIATAVVSAVIFRFIGNPGPLNKAFGYVYITTELFMVTVAIGNNIALNSTWTYIYTAGALLFATSDIILVINTFGKEKTATKRIVCLITYYLGQLLIASSLIFH